MQVESLTCNKCGAPLDVPATVDFLSCGHCGSRLVVNRTGNAHYTETIEQLSKRAERMEEDIDRLALENDLEKLEREWQQEREQYMVRGKDGSLSEPGNALVSNIAIGAFGGLLLLLTIMYFAPWDFASGPLWLGVLVFAGFIAWSIFDAKRKLARYEAAMQEYERRKSEIMLQIQATKDQQR